MLISKLFAGFKTAYFTTFIEILAVSENCLSYGAYIFVLKHLNGTKAKTKGCYQIPHTRITHYI